MYASCPGAPPATGSPLPRPPSQPPAGTRTAPPGTVPCHRSSATTAVTPASASMNAARSAGTVTSTGTNAPPARAVASTATISSADRGRHTPTRTSGPTPSSRSRCPSRPAAASSSP